MHRYTHEVGRFLPDNPRAGERASRQVKPRPALRGGSLEVVGDAWRLWCCSLYFCICLEFPVKNKQTKKATI